MKAAIRIQSRFRGHAVRKLLQGFSYVNGNAEIVQVCKLVCFHCIFCCLYCVVCIGETS